MKNVIMCVGNREGGDDAVGPYVADRLKKHDSNQTMVLDCGVMPENFTSIVKKHQPETIIIVDAVDMNLPPGSIRLVSEEKIGRMHVSTHGIPLTVLINYLKRDFNNVLLVGIQPKKMNGAMSASVKKNAEKLVKILKNNKLDLIEKFE